MKLSHYAILFLIVIMPFSIVARNTTNEYMLVLRDQVRLNNVIDSATQDAVATLIDLNDEFQSLYFNQRFNVTENIALEAIKSFFQTLAINFNMPYIEGKTEAYFSMYVPAIVIVAYDGFYIYTMENTGAGYEYFLSPKIPYAYEDPGPSHAIINFTLGNDIRMFINDAYYEGAFSDNYIEETLDIGSDYNQYKAAYGSNNELVNHLPDITDDMSIVICALREKGINIPDFLVSKSADGDVPMLQDYSRESGDNAASKFHTLRRNVIINTLKDVLQDEINSHTSYASLMGSTYSFALPQISNDEWRNSINDISVLAFIQGIPVGTNNYYNNFALGGSKITETEYLYGNTLGGYKYYHDIDCDIVQAYIGGDTSTGMDNVFINRYDAASQGYFPCYYCRP